MSIVAEDFLGRWRLTRVIEDALTGTQSRLNGHATIERHETHWIYQERGVLVLPGGQEMQAERVYFWHVNGARIEVTFDDGRAFHGFSLNGQHQAEHWCDPDQYDVVYDFEAWPKWRSTWSVSGPRKSYCMVSDYCREM